MKTRTRGKRLSHKKEINVWPYNTRTFWQIENQHKILPNIFFDKGKQFFNKISKLKVSQFLKPTIKGFKDVQSFQGFVDLCSFFG